MTTSSPAANFSYLDAAHDQRLGEIWHTDSGSQTISKFDYEYDLLGQIKKWTQQAGANSPQAYNFDYDRVSQLKGATVRDTSEALLKSYSYDYDPAGNRTVEVIDTSVNGETPNNLNQLTARQGGTGMLPIRGITNEFAWVFVNGNYAPSKADNSFEGKAWVTPGENPVTVEAIDENGNTTTNHYNVTVTGSGSKTLTYDANGNLTSDGMRTFEWDPLNRLTAVTSGTHRSEFTYNGLTQRVKIVEKDDGTVTSTKQFVWIPGDTQPSEERDGSNAVTKRYYVQGMQVGTTNYYYTRDHLGSIREMTDSSGTVQTRYDYDPYGRRTKLSGSVDADLGFTGHYYHQPSGLHLALYRAYNADLGRWISRDPIGEKAGINLYAYVGNNPATFIDPLGLKTCWRPANVTYFGDYQGNPAKGIPADTEGAYKKGFLADGDLAVGNYGAGPKTPDTGKLYGPDQPAYPAGSILTVYPPRGGLIIGRVSDWGSYNIKHPQYGAADWVDVFDPVKSKAKSGGSGWISFDVDDDKPCPPGSSQYPEGAPGQGPCPRSTLA